MTHDRTRMASLRTVCAALAAAAVLLYLARGCEAADAGPDPFVRMTSPSGCSGGVIHASREHGVWIATCRHCASRPGSPVTLRFYWSGYEGPAVRGRLVRAHRQFDCAIAWVDAKHFAVLPQTVPLATPAEGPYTGQTVLAAGSHAGNTKEPSMRKMAIAEINRDGYGFDLNGSAWSGHSGGAVVDNRTGRLLGVLWGTYTDGHGRRTGGRVTAAPAIWETLYNPHGRALSISPTQSLRQAAHSQAPGEAHLGAARFKKVAGQAFFTVVDEIETADAEPNVYVYGGHQPDIRREVSNSHMLTEHIDVIFKPGHTKRATVEFFANGKRYSWDHWPGADSVVKYLKAYGVVAECPGYRCPPYRQQPEQQMPLNPWQLPFGQRPPAPPPSTPAPPPPVVDDGRIEKLTDQFDEFKQLVTQTISEVSDKVDAAQEVQQTVEDVATAVNKVEQLKQELDEAHQIRALIAASNETFDNKGEPVEEQREPAPESGFVRGKDYNTIVAVLLALLAAFGISRFKPKPKGKESHAPKTEGPDK